MGIPEDRADPVGVVAPRAALALPRTHGTRVRGAPQRGALGPLAPRLAPLAPAARALVLPHSTVRVRPASVRAVQRPNRGQGGLRGFTLWATLSSSSRILPP